MLTANVTVAVPFGAFVGPGAGGAASVAVLLLAVLLLASLLLVTLVLVDVTEAAALLVEALLVTLLPLPVATRVPWTVPLAVLPWLELLAGPALPEVPHASASVARPATSTHAAIQRLLICLLDRP